MKYFLFTVIFLNSFFSLAQGVIEDLDSLGGNRALLEKINLNSGKRIELVQKRTTDRTHRLEMAPEYKYVSKGNTYLNSSSAGLSLRYHINPYWSVGTKYNYFYNQLTPEAERLIDEAMKVGDINPDMELALIPELNWLKTSIMGSLSYYPIYGKINWFNRAIIHFDMYITLGAGQVELRKGNSASFLGGAGFGLWPSQYLSMRLEYNYQIYNAKYQSGVKQLDMNTLSFSLGYLI